MERYYEITREERQFCAVLAHQLMQTGRNLETFLGMVNDLLPSDGRYRIEGLEDAEIYLEFAYLRDWWSALPARHDGDKKKANTEKRNFILNQIACFPGLGPLAIPAPDEPSEFNRLFMGDKGSKIKHDIVYPGSWNVKAISETFAKEQLRPLCMFKWAFNIKPDLVIVLPGQPPLVVEAKLISGEGQYPASGLERGIFDKKLGAGKGRVNQFELQPLMFDHLLQTPCRSVVLKRDRLADEENLVLTWKAVFDCMDVGNSIPFVKRLTSSSMLRNKATA